MILFRAITDENLDLILNMDHPDIGRFVESNGTSIAQAWLRREKKCVHAFAIYFYETPVGFMMLSENLEKRRILLWRLLIDRKYENLGYGTAAVKEIVHLAEESKKYDQMTLYCRSDNVKALHLYQKIGFIPTGEVEDGDLILMHSL